ncbi:MAG: acyltransferase [Flavipsychrobacter sp.]|nr:acyltransferase [Flavipsychrobacter sp.]
MHLKHYKELDGIRAIAALMVMFFHFFIDIQSDNWLLLAIQKISIVGQTGVSLFFVLSGFLISRILLNTKNDDSYFVNFYVRRSLRIFPLYFFFLVLFYFILPPLENKAIPPFSQQVYFWTYLQNLALTFNWNFAGPGHFWSLAVEEHFYLFWPFVIYFLNQHQIKRAVLIMIILACITRFVLLQNNLEVFYFTFSRMDELSVGALLAILEREGKLIAANAYKLLISFIAVFIPTVIIWIVSSGMAIDAIQIIKFVLLSFAFFSIIGFVISVKENHWLKNALKNIFLSYTGKISYGLYVYHPVCFYFIQTYFPIDSILVSMLVSFAFSYLVAGFSYRFFESRFLVLKDRFSHGKSGALQKVF